MLLHGKFYIDKSVIIGKINMNVKEEDVHITSAKYNEDGSVDISFVISVSELDAKDRGKFSLSPQCPRKRF